MSVIDPVFAKSQLLLLLSDHYQHPNGQVVISCFDQSPNGQVAVSWFIVVMDRLHFDSLMRLGVKYPVRQVSSDCVTDAWTDC